MTDSPRECIKCGKTMAPHVILDIEIDHCPGCGGMWLDDGEIRALASRPTEALGQLGSLESHIAGFTATDPGMVQTVLDTPCPACGGKLLHAVFGPTVIEHCSSCHGIFIDRGELEKAMKLVDTTAATTIVALARSVQTSGTLGA